MVFARRKVELDFQTIVLSTNYFFIAHVSLRVFLDDRLENRLIKICPIVAKKCLLHIFSFTERGVLDSRVYNDAKRILYGEH